MTHIKTLFFLLVFALQSPTSVAAAAVLSGNYLEGLWSMGGKEGCTSGHAVYVIFHNNHTLEAGRGQSVSAVGFWESGDDSVTVHLLVSPGSGGGGHPFHQQRYYYQYMSPRILAIQADSFDYTQDTGAEAGEKKTLTRCK